MKKRVVVTGVGIISSIGQGKAAFWENVIKGTSGITKISSWDTTGFKCQYGGEIHDFSPAEYISRRRIQFLGRTSQLAVAASKLALEDAQVQTAMLTKYKAGVLIGTTVGERPMEELMETWARSGLDEIRRKKISQATANNIPANVGIEFKTRGLNCLIPTACAAGNYSVGYGLDLIKNGDLNFALAGGAEAFSRIAYAGFQRLYAMSPDRCQPFDKNRKGILLGEGSAMLFLESLDSALKRKVPMYAEVLGYGMSCDAHHVTAPHPEGVAKAMRRALHDSNISAQDVDYICAHGTGTPMNDKIESQAIKDVFGEHARKVAVSSIKSMIGHTLGAASAIEAGVCCLAIKEGIIPPTINFQTPDPECDIDCVPNKARKANLKVVLNNGFAFGGNNCCVVFADVHSRE